jgi:voltage-gated potassium channel Kch
MQIKTPGDALWWSVETITTVAYGEFYPVTFTGKIIATGVMFAAIGILWTLIPLLSSRFIATRLKKARSGLLDETKEVIKNRIDEIEKLNGEDLERLISILNREIEVSLPTVLFLILLYLYATDSSGF